MPTAQRSRSGLAISPALIYFLIAYVLVTVLASGLTITYATVNHSPDPQPGVGMLQAPAFVATVPYHVLIMLLIWPLFAWLYFRKRRPASSEEESQQTLRSSSSLADLRYGRRLRWLRSHQERVVHDSARTLRRLPALDHFDIHLDLPQPLDSLVALAMAHNGFQQTTRFNFVKTCFRTSED